MSAASSGTRAPIAANSPWPKYHQIYLVLRQQIQEGGFPDGSPLPTELDLTADFGVSRITIRKAMERLDREGWIERHRGKGTYARPALSPSPVQASVSGAIENLIAMGLETDVSVISLEYVRAAADVTDALQIDTGVGVQKVVRLRSYQGHPFSHLLTYVPEVLGRCFTEADLASTPLLVLLERAGAKVARAEQSISATLATPDIAGLLKMEAGDALLSIRRVVFDDRDRPIEYIRGLYRPDTYEHQMSFHRRSEPTGPFWRIDQHD